MKFVSVPIIGLSCRHDRCELGRLDRRLVPYGATDRGLALSLDRLLHRVSPRKLRIILGDLHSAVRYRRNELILIWNTPASSCLA